MSDVHTANARLAEIRKAQGIGSVKPIERQNAVILVNQLQRANGINPASLETIGDLAQRIAVNAPKPPRRKHAGDDHQNS